MSSLTSNSVARELVEWLPELPEGVCYPTKRYNGSGYVRRRDTGIRAFIREFWVPVFVRCEISSNWERLERVDYRAYKAFEDDIQRNGLPSDIPYSSGKGATRVLKPKKIAAPSRSTPMYRLLIKEPRPEPSAREKARAQWLERFPQPNSP